MQVKTFHISEVEEANKFMTDSFLSQDGAVQVTSDNQIVVFYLANEGDYEKSFVTHMINSLKQNLFHEEVNKVAVEATYESMKDEGLSTYPEFDDLGKKSKEIDKNITMFKAKIKALEAWTQKSI